MPKTFGLSVRVERMWNLRIIEPVRYYQLMNLIINVKFVLTHSWGVQEETTVLNLQCLTLRENTERPETVDGGTGTLVGCDTESIVAESLKILEGKGKTGTAPEIWDGLTAERIAEILNQL